MTDQRIIYLPHLSFLETARSLSNYDLSKEIDTVLDTLDVLNGKADNPDCVWSARAWDGHEELLNLFGGQLCLESRTTRKINMAKDQRWSRLNSAVRPAPSGQPEWIGNVEIHRSHRSDLIFMQAKRGRAKNERDYAELWPNTPERMPVFWATAEKPDRLLISPEDINRLKVTGHRTMPKGFKLGKEGKVKTK